MVSAEDLEGHPEDVNEVDQGASSAINVFVTGQPGIHLSYSFPAFQSL